jgi:hypothetical protein
MANSCNRFRQVSVQISFVVFLLAPLWQRAAYAADNCPWINQATAGGLLGGDAVASYTAASADKPAVCLFTRTTSDGKRALLITVDATTSPAHDRLAAMEKECGGPSAPLAAIGNETVLCGARRHGANSSESALGRVRDQVFAITLSSTIRDDGDFVDENLRVRLATAAEQVAGNLF